MGKLGKGYAETVYYLCNFPVDLKLFQNSLFQKIKEADVLVTLFPFST